MAGASPAYSRRAESGKHCLDKIRREKEYEGRQTVRANAHCECANNKRSTSTYSAFRHSPEMAAAAAHSRLSSTFVQRCGKKVFCDLYAFDLQRRLQIDVEGAYAPREEGQLHSSEEVLQCRRPSLCGIPLLP